MKTTKPDVWRRSRDGSDLPTERQARITRILDTALQVADDILALLKLIREEHRRELR